MIYECTYSTIAKVQNSEEQSSFIIAGDFNAYHKEFLQSSSPTDRHGEQLLEFCVFSGLNQVVQGSTHDSGSLLDLVLNVTAIGLNAPLVL